MKLINRKQAAELLAVKPDTIRKWQNEGKIIASCYINNRPRYLIENLEKLIDNNKDKLITRKQAAEILSVEIWTIKKWQLENKFKAVCYINNRPRYNLNDIKNIIKL
jgi:predicted site-specific integrase-resolvase